MKINEIYKSIQGESTYAGLPCVFVRLTYCNLRCSYCDTAYAFYEGQEMSLEQVIQAIRECDCSLVEITGGEPLLQKEVYPLMDRLIAEGFLVLLETGGSLDIGEVHPSVIKIMDLKCPSSEESQKNRYDNLHKLQPHDEIKFVIGNRADYLWALDIMRKHHLDEKYRILFSTVFGTLQPSELVNWILEDKLNVRFQLQIHKYIWNPKKRGV
jgi:7-carboxy-7-deazaguanine synthase